MMCILVDQAPPNTFNVIVWALHRRHHLPVASKSKKLAHSGGLFGKMAQTIRAMIAMVKSRVFLGMVIPPLMGILIIGPYKPRILGWVSHPLLYGNNGSLDPSTYNKQNKHRYMLISQDVPISNIFSLANVLVSTAESAPDSGPQDSPLSYTCEAVSPIPFVPCCQEALMVMRG